MRLQRIGYCVEFADKILFGMGLHCEFNVLCKQDVRQTPNGLVNGVKIGGRGNRKLCRFVNSRACMWECVFGDLGTGIDVATKRVDPRDLAFKQRTHDTLHEPRADCSPGPDPSISANRATIHPRRASGHSTGGLCAALADL